jgi:hypothetical protein
MRIRTLLATTVATALLVTPAWAAKEDHAPKGKAHGASCKGLSKKHVKGVKGTPFSLCVKAAAQHHRAEPEATATPEATG